MAAIQRFEDTTIVFNDENTVANREQLQELYGVPRKTLQDNINALKSDGEIVGAKIRPKSGRPYEVYNLEEIISIGFRLRSPKALAFQKWARNVIKEKLTEAHKKRLDAEAKLQLQQYQLDRLWDKSDHEQLYKKDTSKSSLN